MGAAYHNTQVTDLPEPLLPCPFCGSKASMWHERRHGRGMCTVSCDDPLCMVRQVGGGTRKKDQELDALRSWNRRAQPEQAAQVEAVDEVAALAEFTEYFVKNYPGPNTIIGDPKWHAPRLFRAAQRALATQQPPTGEAGHGVASATVRDGVDSWDVECRFRDGQKFAAVQVDREHEGLAHAIARFLGQP